MLVSYLLVSDVFDAMLTIWQATSFNHDGDEWKSEYDDDGRYPYEDRCIALPLAPRDAGW